jgi:hypothetical protein
LFAKKDSANNTNLVRKREGSRGVFVSAYPIRFLKSHAYYGIVSLRNYSFAFSLGRLVIWRKLIKKRRWPCFMGALKNFKTLLKPVWGGASFLIAASLIFIPAYIIFEYQQYLSAYKSKQREELKVIQGKTKTLLETIKELAKLTGDYIAATKGDSKEIQNILITTPRLYDLEELPKIQKIAYYKFSNPSKLITRYDILPLKTPVTSETQSSDNKALHRFSQDLFLSYGTHLLLSGLNLGIIAELLGDPFGLKPILPRTEKSLRQATQVFANKVRDLTTKKVTEATPSLSVL